MPPPVRKNPAAYHYHAYDFVGSAPWTLSAAQPNRNNYQFYSMLQDLTGLQQYGTRQPRNVPNIVLQTPGAPIQDQITPAPWNMNTLALSFGNRNNHLNPPTVVFTGGIHAREWIASEFVYLLAEYLIRNYAPGPRYANSYQQTLSQLVDRRKIVIVPMVNPAGNYVTVFGPNARLWRKNRRQLPNTVVGWRNALNANGGVGPMHAPLRNFAPGPGGVPTTVTYETPRYGTNPLQYDTITVQLNPAAKGVDGNRNFDTPGWGYETEDDEEGQPTDQAYFGTDRLSEAETDNIAILVNPGAVNASIDYHSYGQLILYPTEGVTGVQNIRLGQALQRLIASTLRWTLSYDYKLGTDMGLLRYEAVSSVADYMATAKNSRAFTIELDPTSDTVGFELPETQIMAVFEKNIRAALALIASARIANLQVTGGGRFSRHQPVTAAIAQFLTWNVFGRGNRLPS